MTEMTLREARLLAAQYQSSGYIGRTFASFASGCLVSYERFVEECDMTATECGFDSHEDMRTLKEWAQDTDEECWTDMDTGDYE